MACRGCLGCLLKLLNLLLTLVGLAMVGYGIYLFVEYKRADGDAALSPVSDDHGLMLQLGRPMLMAVSLSESFFDKLPKAWYGLFFKWVFFVILICAFRLLLAQLCLYL